MSESLEARVLAALSRSQNPRLENDLLSAGMIRDLSVNDEGRVTFTFLLAPDDPATLVRSARAAVAAVEGVRREEIKINVTNPAGPARATPGPPTGPGVATEMPAASQPNPTGCCAVSKATRTMPLVSQQYTRRASTSYPSELSIISERPVSSSASA